LFAASHALGPKKSMLQYEVLGFRVPWITTAAAMDPMSCSTPKLEEFAVCD
jgi:hypothetical protein